MQAFLIDPTTRTVEPVEYSGDWRTVAPMLGCDLFTVVQLNEADDVVFVDDEGLLKSGDLPCFRLPAFYPGTLAGKGLVLGTDAEGDSIAPQKITLEDLRANVQFGTVNPDTLDLSPKVFPFERWKVWETGFESDAVYVEAPEPYATEWGRAALRAKNLGRNDAEINVQRVTP